MYIHGLSITEGAPGVGKGGHLPSVPHPQLRVKSSKNGHFMYKVVTTDGLLRVLPPLKNVLPLKYLTLRRRKTNELKKQQQQQQQQQQQNNLSYGGTPRQKILPKASMIL